MEPQSDSTEWLSTCYFYLASREAQHEHMMGPDAMIFIFWMLSFKPAFSFSCFTLIKRLSYTLLSDIRVMSSAYLRLLIFLPAILIPAWDSTSPVFHMVFSAYKLNNQGDSTQLCRTPFPILNQLVVPCPVLTVVSWPIHRFLRSQVRWYGTTIFHSLLWPTQSKALP